MSENRRAYEIISAYYDFWQAENVGPGASPGNWALYAHKLIRDFSARNLSVTADSQKTESSVLFDLGCGTGHIASAMADLGYQVTGVDFSDEMLTLANYLHGDKGIVFVNQDIRDLDIPYKADVITSFLDTVNHLQSKEDLKRFFSSCAVHLKAGGLLIFDLLSLTYYKDILNEKTFTEFIGRDLLVWDNYFDPETHINTADLSLFAALDTDETEYDNEDGDNLNFAYDYEEAPEEDAFLYERYDVRITEKYHMESEVIGLLEENAFELKGIFADLSEREPDDESQRIFYVALLTNNGS